MVMAAVCAREFCAVKTAREIENNRKKTVMICGMIAPKHRWRGTRKTLWKYFSRNASLKFRLTGKPGVPHAFGKVRWQSHVEGVVAGFSAETPDLTS
jgi:hypothetical protein